MTGKRKLNTPRMDDLNQMSNDELKEILAETKRLKMAYKYHDRFGEIKPNPAAIRQNRILMARVLTIMQKRGI